MSERKDEKWLDSQLQRIINGSAPQFDAEAWKQEHRDEYQTLLARREQPAGWGLPHRFWMSPRTWWGKPHLMTIARVAIAATIVILASVGLMWRMRHGPDVPPTGSSPAPVRSPAQMVSMISLSGAFRRGGMEALNKQLDQAVEQLGPRPTDISTAGLLMDLES